MDAVRGASEDQTELYSGYSEGGLERSNDEMRHSSNSYTHLETRCIYSS